MISVARVRHLAVREDEWFNLLPNERVLSAEYEHPWMHLIVLAEDADVPALIDGSQTP